jgi:hypothetical protein
LQAALAQDVEPSRKILDARDPINPARAAAPIATTAYALASSSMLPLTFSLTSTLPVTASSPTSTVKADKDQKKKWGKKEIIGIGVAVPGAFIVSGGIVFLCFLCRGEPRGRAYGAGGGLTVEVGQAATED